MFLQSALLDLWLVSGGSGDFSCFVFCFWLIIEESFGSELATICSYYIKIVQIAAVNSTDLVRWLPDIVLQVHDQTCEHYIYILYIYIMNIEHTER